MKSAEINVMYHLVGEQTLPVFLGARQFPNAKHVLWFTERSAKASEYLSEVMKKHNLHVEAQSLGNENAAYDLTRLRDTFNHAFLDDASRGEYIGLNATGGTKLMSLISLTTLEASAPKDHFMAYYVDTNNRKLLFLAGSWDSEEICTKMTIEDFIGLAGAHVHRAGLDQHSKDLLSRKELVLALWPWRVAIQIYQQSFANLTAKRYANITVPPDEYVALMEKITQKYPRFPAVHQHPGFNQDWRKEARFLAGGWFEEYCFWQILAAQQQEAIREIRVGVEPAWIHSSSAAQEFDICYTDGLRLFILECKAGVIFQEYIQKLENICGHFSGSLGRAALVTLNDIGKYKAVSERFRFSNNLACFCGDQGVASICENIWRIPPGQINRQTERKPGASSPKQAK